MIDPDFSTKATTFIEKTCNGPPNRNATNQQV